MTQTTSTVITVANYIDGGWSQAASGATIESRDPSNGDLVAIAPLSGVEDLDAAIAAARRTFDDGAWPATSGRERASILMELAGLLRAEAEPLARLVAIEMGKPIRYVREREIALTKSTNSTSWPSCPATSVALGRESALINRVHEKQA